MCLASPSISDLASLSTSHESKRRWLTRVMLDSRRALAMTHHETSAGLINPVAEVCALARRNGLRTLVDATSSAGAEDLDVTRDGIDVCITSSGKCLHAPPGIAVACVRRDMLAARAGAAPRSYSLDLLRHHDQLEANSQTPFTPAVPLFVALDRAVEELLEQGVAERRRSYLRRRAFLAAGLRPPRAAAAPPAGGHRGLLDTHGRGSARARTR